MEQTQRIEELINDLADFRRRSHARRELMLLGAAAAGQLINVLRDAERPENMRWSAISVLAESKCESAVPTLLEIARAETHLRREAFRALQTITGHDIGDDPDAWAEALGAGTTQPEAGAQPAAQEPPTAPSEREMFALFKEALENAAAVLSWEEPGYVYARIPLAEGRKQQVVATFDEADASGCPLAMIYTECGSAPDGIADVLADRNATLEYGQFIVEADDEGGGRKVIMRHALPCADLTAPLVRNMVLQMASDADELESQISHSDRI